MLLLFASAVGKYITVFKQTEVSDGAAVAKHDENQFASFPQDTIPE